jgi:hypothetical protein
LIGFFVLEAESLLCRINGVNAHKQGVFCAISRGSSVNSYSPEYLGGTLYFIIVTVSITFSDGKTKEVTDKAEWKSGSYKIATVTAGTVKAVAYGKSYVTAKYGG